MKRILTYLSFSFLLVSTNSFAQVVTDTLYVSQDAFVNSGASTTNYGGDTLLNVYHDTASTVQVYRSFLQFDFSGIPANAIVASAKLRLVPNTVVDSINHPIYISRCDTIWSESGINWSNKPDVYTTGQYSFTHAQTQNTTLQEFNITNLVQNFVNYPHLNNGIQIRLQDETQPNDCGIIYYSSEHDTVQWRPSLEINYILEPDIVGYVSHCTNGNNDGSINFTISGGSNAWTSYLVYKREIGSYTTIESGTTVNNTTIDVSALSPGIYVLAIRDSLYSISSDSKYWFHKWFLVGEEGATTSVSCFWSESYIEDARLSVTNNSSVTTPDYANTNYGQLGESSATVLHPSYWNSMNTASLYRFYIDFDQQLEFTDSELILKSQPSGLYRYCNSSNAAEVRRVSSGWQENVVTWNTRPSVDSTVSIVIPQTTACATNLTGTDTLSVETFVTYWQNNPAENYGVEVAMQDYTQVGYGRRIYAGSYQGMNGPHLDLSFTVRPKIETTYIDTLGKGHITVNAPAAELPYTYLISYDTLPDFDTIWYAVRDSIQIDSADFYKGRQNTRNYTFTNLPNDHYFIGVYDNNGTMILSEEVYLTPTFEVFDSTDLDVDGDTLKVKSGETEATATMFASLPIEESGGFELEVVTLADDLVVGMDNVDDAFPTTTRDYLYALEIKTTGKVYALKDTIILDSTTVSVGDKLKMYKDEFNVMFFYKGEIEFASDTLADTLTNDLKLQVQLKGANSKAMFKGFSKGMKKPKLKYTVEHADCGDSEGSVTISVPSTTFFAPTLNNYTIFDSDNIQVASGTSTATVNLVPGIYTLHYNYTIGSTSYPFQVQFIIGFKILWTNLSNITEVPGTFNAITPTSYSTGASANSVNAADQNYDNWIQFTTQGKSSTFSLAYERVQLENTSGDYPVRLYIFEPGGGIISKFVYVFDENSYVGEFIGDMNPIRIELTSTGTVDVYNNNTLEYSFASTTGGHLKADAEEFKNVQIDNAIASFCYPTNTYVAKTKPYTDGSYFITIDDLLKFQYTGEYNQSDLVYELTDENGTVISTANYTIDLTSGSGILKKNADNRYTLDMEALPGGFYILTITNVKGEKHYLRIKN